MTDNIIPFPRRRRPIPIKKHGRRACSLFALGLGALRKIAASANPAQVIVFLQQLLSSKLSVNQLNSWPYKSESSTMGRDNKIHFNMILPPSNPPIWRVSFLTLLFFALVNERNDIFP